MAAHKTSRKTPSKPSPQSYRDLSTHDILLLASILSHQPSPSTPRPSHQWQTYAQLTKQAIDALPPHLRSHPSTWHKYANKRISASLRADVHELCPLHQTLNRPVLLSMFRWVRHEIGVAIPATLLPLVREGRLRAEVRALFVRLRKVGAMWHTPAAYSAMYGAEAEDRWAEQVDRCPACVLSRMGGDAETLVALRAGMLARSRSVMVRESRRMRFVEALIERGFEEERSVKMMEDATWIGAEVKTIWKQRRGIGKKVEVKGEAEEMPLTPMPVEKPLPVDLYVSLRGVESVATTPLSKPFADCSARDEVDSDNGSVYSSHEGETEEVGIYDDINDIIQEYEHMMSRATLLSPRHLSKRKGQMSSTISQPQRPAESRAISYMQDLRVNPFRSGIQSLEGDGESTTVSQFLGPRRQGRRI